MSHTLLIHALIILFIAAALPLSLVLLAHSTKPVSLSLALALALAIFTGTVSLIMLIEGLTGLSFVPFSILLPYGLLCAAGAVACWRMRIKVTLPRLDRWRGLSLAILVAISAAIIFNAVNLPFYRDDTLGIYQPQALEMFLSRQLIPLSGADSLYKTYPMLAQMNYTFVYLFSGWDNDYSAKLISALLSIGCLVGAFQLAQYGAGEDAGWVAALLLALTPAYGKWASSGYVDLPMAFFYALSGLFALRLWERGSVKDAALAGAMMGLAMWTKNAALLGTILLLIWLAWSAARKRIRWQAAAAALLACVLIAAPWYIRNLIGAGFIMPATAWVDEAEQSLANLLVFASKPENFGFAGWIFIFGVVSAIITVFRRRLDAPPEMLLLLWVVPFFLAWWLFASYDPRFLLLFLPPLSALGGIFLARVWLRMPLTWRRRSRLAAALVASAFTAFILWNSVDYKDELLRQPFMSDGERRELVGRIPTEMPPP